MTGAAAASALSIGASGLSSVVKGIGESNTQEYLAARDERAAELGRVRAEQTDTHLREELNRTLATIDAVRASANTDPFSPTSMVIKEEQSRVSDRERNIRVSSIRAQADEDERAAQYRRSVASSALLSGVLSGIGTVGKGIAKGMG